MADRVTSLRAKLAEMGRADEAVFVARRDAGPIASLNPGDPERHESSFALYAVQHTARRSQVTASGSPPPSFAPSPVESGIPGPFRYLYRLRLVT